jgi:hypothetical protein
VARLFGDHGKNNKPKLSVVEVRISFAPALSPMILPAISRLAPKPESGAGSTTPSGFS